MRWDNLFDDLESQLEQGLGAEEVDLLAEEERLRLGRITLRERLLALHGRGGAGVRLTLVDGQRLLVRTTAFGKDWCSVDIVGESGAHRQGILPLGAIAGVGLDREQVAASLAGAGVGEAMGALSARLGISFVLRDLCRRRSAVELDVAGLRLFGTVDRVGRDHLDLAEHERGAARRESAVSGYRLVAIDQLVLVRI